MVSHRILRKWTKIVWGYTIYITQHKYNTDKCSPVLIHTGIKKRKWVGMVTKTQSFKEHLKENCCYLFIAPKDIAFIHKGLPMHIRPFAPVLL